MSESQIRAARCVDLKRITEIYNHYVIHTPVTFDVEPYTVEGREPWFAQFSEVGRHRLLVAEENNVILGYAGSLRWRPKTAYDTTVETTIYCAPDAVGRGIGFKRVGVFSEVGRKFGKYWDVSWNERAN